jgi:hypothetical protein
MLATCPCNTCSQPIEFDHEQKGQTLNCPHCGVDTVLFLPAVKPPPVAKSIEPATKPIKPKPRHSVLLPLLVFAAGAVFILEAGFAYASGENIMHQLYSALYFGFGALLLSASFLLYYVRTIANKS